MKLLSKRGCIFLFWEFCCIFPGCPQELFFFYLRYHQRWMRLLAGPTFLSTPGIYIIFDLYCYYYIFISILGIILLWVFFFFFWFFFSFVLSHLLGEKMQVMKQETVTLWMRILFSRGSKSYFMKKCCSSL